MSVHQCPDCELRFLSESDLRDHLDTDHPGAVGEHFPHPGPHSDWPREPK
jgi:hypothetical protein